MSSQQQTKNTKLQEAHTLYSSITRWLVSKGANGGILPNGGVLIVVFIQLLGWFQAERISRAIAKGFSLPAGRRRPDAFSLSGRVIGWMVENGAVITLCNIRSLLPHPEPIPDKQAEGTQTQVFLRTLQVIASNIAISVCSNLIAEEGSVFLHHLTSTRLYSKVPYFTDQRRSANPLTFGALKDWIRGNGILQLVSDKQKIIIRTAQL